MQPPKCFASALARQMFAALLIFAAAFLAGCQSDGTPKTYSVKGKVVHKKSQSPVTQGTVMFESVSEPKVLASGELQADGTFELASDLGKPGTVAGEHRVMIEPPFPEPGQKAPFPKRYASFKTSKLTATVEPRDNNDVTLEVD